MTAIVGADETQAFIAQSENHVRHWQANAACSRIALLANRNHYTILGELMEQRSIIAKLIGSHVRGLQ